MKRIELYRVPPNLDDECIIITCLSCNNMEPQAEICVRAFKDCTLLQCIDAVEKTVYNHPFLTSFFEITCVNCKTFLLDYHLTEFVRPFFILGGSNVAIELMKKYLKETHNIDAEITQ